MPKAPSKPLTTAGKARRHTKRTPTPEASTSAAAKEANRTTTSATDPLQWRPRASADSMMTKTDAKKKYHLSEKDFAQLHPADMKPNPHGKHMIKLYFERNIEKAAWKKHGGPEGFNAYLQECYQKHVDAGKEHFFPKPDGYSDDATYPGTASASGAQGPSMSIGRLPGAPISMSDHRAKQSSCLVKARKSMPPWLWDSMNDAVDFYYLHPYGTNRWPTVNEREAAMCHTAARAFVDRYPARPDQPLPASPAVAHLRATLAEAPTVGKTHWGQPAAGLVYIPRWAPGDDDGFYEWDEVYATRVYSALDALVQAHGMGVEGWATVRWEVYNKYKECVKKSIMYEHPNDWEDKAWRWLDEEDLAQHVQAVGSTLQ